MGQKLVTIKFNAGSSSDLWDPSLNPEFKVEISGSSGWQVQSNYYPDLVKMSNLPVNLGSLQTLTTGIIQGLIQNNRNIAFLADDSVDKWRIQFRESFLTEGGWQMLASGSFN